MFSDLVNQRAYLMARSEEYATKRAEMAIKLWRKRVKTKTTNKADVLEYLLHNRKKGISQAEAIGFIGDYRLSATVKDLRDDGFAIITKAEPNVKKHGNHARYFLIFEGETESDFSINH